jgi:hypothetical protein
MHGHTTKSQTHKTVSSNWVPKFLNSRGLTESTGPQTSQSHIYKHAPSLTRTRRRPPQCRPDGTPFAPGPQTRPAAVVLVNRCCPQPPWPRKRGQFMKSMIFTETYRITRTADLRTWTNARERTPLSSTHLAPTPRAPKTTELSSDHLRSPTWPNYRKRNLATSSHTCPSGKESSKNPYMISPTPERLDTSKKHNIIS